MEDNDAIFRKHDQSIRAAMQADANGALEEKNAMEGGGSGVITFKPSAERYGWPDTVILDTKDLDDAELANYIEVCGSDFDGMPFAFRDAIVRLLKRACG